MNSDLGSMIHKKALECGYDNCGVIAIKALDEYNNRLKERIEKIPESVVVLKSPIAFLKLQENYPWAKSVVVCAENYGKYRFPSSLQGKYAKSFLLSSSLPEHPNRKGKEAFEQWMTKAGIHYAGGETNMPSKILPLRQAAVAAGLGIFRKNNFFYGPKGSWYGLEGYLIDVSCKYLQKSDLKPCADKCDLCQRACKTSALLAPFTMNPVNCTSFLTTFAEGNIPDHMEAEQLSEWIMGCDACQDACPHNMRHDWNKGEEFPGLNDIEKLLQPENIIKASDEELIENVIPRSAYHLRNDQVDVLRKCAKRVLDIQDRKLDANSNLTD